MQRTPRLFVIVATLAIGCPIGCSDDAPNGKRDAPAGSDAAIGSDAPGIDAGFCGSDFELDGEYVDWDSGGSGQFLGIDNATVALVGETTGSDSEHTPPNGRIRLCVEGNHNFTLSFTPDPNDTTNPLDPTDTNDPYPLTGVAVISPGFIGASVSMRNFRQKRLTSMFAQIGSAYDPAKGQLFVHTNGATGVTFSLAQAHATAQAFGSDATWAAGSAGAYVFFPNVDLSGGSDLTLTSDDSTLTISSPITAAAGQLTYVEAGHITAF